MLHAMGGGGEAVSDDLIDTFNVLGNITDEKARKMRQHLRESELTAMTPGNARRSRCRSEACERRAAATRHTV